MRGRTRVLQYTRCYENSELLSSMVGWLVGEVGGSVAAVASQLHCVLDQLRSMLPDVYFSCV